MQAATAFEITGYDAAEPAVHVEQGVGVRLGRVGVEPLPRLLHARLGLLQRDHLCGLPDVRVRRRCRPSR